MDVGLAVAVAVAAGLVIFHRLDIAAWYDEAHSYALSTLPWHVLMGQYVWGSESNMFLYYLLLRGWLWITSHLGILPTELVLRAPSAVAAVAAGAMVYLLGLRIAGRIAGVVAAGLYVTNFLQMILAQNARAYSLELFLLCLSTYALVAAFESERTERRWWIVFVAANVLAVYTALFSTLVIAAQVAWLAALLLIPGQRDWILRRARPLIVSLAAIGVLVAPMMLDAVVHGGPVWVPPATFSTLKDFFWFLGGGSHRYAEVLIATGAIGVFAAMPTVARLPLVARIFATDPATGRRSLLLISWAVVPIGLSFALTQPELNLHLFFHRYLVVVVPPLALLAGLGVSSLRWIPLRAVAAVGLAALSWGPLSLYYTLAQVQDFRSPMAWVEQRYQPGDGIACYPELQCSIPVAYYMDSLAGAAHMDPDSPGLWTWDGHISQPVTDATLRQYGARHRELFFIFGPLSRDPATAAAAQQLELRLATCMRQVGEFDAPATSATVSVYEYAGPLSANCGS